MLLCPAQSRLAPLAAPAGVVVMNAPALKVSLGRSNERMVQDSLGKDRRMDDAFFGLKDAKPLELPHAWFPGQNLLP